MILSIVSKLPKNFGDLRLKARLTPAHSFLLHHLNIYSMLTRSLRYISSQWIYLVLLFLFPNNLLAQVSVDGTWEGTITLERPAPKKEYKFELVLKREGKKIIGTSYIYYDEDQPVAMNLSGTYFRDRSMRLFNQDVLFPYDEPNKEKYIRKYQLMYQRSAFYPDMIEGYWQEKNDPIFAKYRQGRVSLTKKKKTTKA